MTADGPPKRTASEIGRTNRAEGARAERACATLMGGKRNVMSGGSSLGGGDLVFPPNDPFADFSWEVKRRKLVPEIVRKALDQAQAEASGQKFGGRKAPAAIIIPHGVPVERAVVCFRLADFVTWARALVEMGSQSQVKSLVRQMRHQLDELERFV